MAIRDYLRLTNPPIVGLLVFTAVAGGIIAGGARDPLQLLGIAVAITLSSMGARALTNYVDRDMDARMERTRDRPLPSGAIPPPRALAYGIALAALGLVATLPLGLVPVGLVAIGLADNVIVYNVLTKRRTYWNIILGAPSGGIPVLVGYVAVAGRIDLTGILLASLVVLWTPIHIWSLAIRSREDYARAQVPMLPVVLGVRSGIRCIAATSALLAIFTLALPFVPGSPFGYATGIGAAGLGAVLIAASALLIHRPTLINAWRLFKLTSPYLAVLFLLMAVDAAAARPPW